MGYEVVRAALAASVAFTGLSAAAAAAQEVSIPAAVAPAVAPAQLVPAVATGPAATGLQDAVLLVEDVEPALPAGSSPAFVPPARDEGGYVTPNRNLSPEEKTWHVRVALNVAALGCRGAGAEALVGGYNALLTRGRAMLAETTGAMTARYRARYGTAWQARYDDAMTKLYNFWALPPAQARFCAVAQAVMQEMEAVDAVAFPVFAAAVLPRLEEPITGFFAAFDGYRTAHEAWRTRRARAMIAAAVPATGAPSANATASVPAPTQAVAAVASVAPPALPQAAVPQPVVVAPSLPRPAVLVLVRAGAGEP